jgi:arabinogalactan oligomer/maltooligosaccharide transport system permease protein
LARLALLLLALGCVLGQGCAPVAEPVILWHSYRGDEEVALKQAADAFAAETGIAVSLLGVPHDAYSTKLETAVPYGHGPDVFIDAHERIGSYASRNMVVPLDDIVLRGGIPAFEKTSFDATTFEGHVYGFPMAEKCLALIVNERLLPDKVGSFDELRALKDKNALPAGVFPIAFEAENIYFHVPFLHAFGGRMLTPDGRFGVQGAPAERSMQYARDLIRQGVAPEEASGALVKQLFVGGKAATMIGGPWTLAELPDSVKYRVAPLPEISEAPERLRPFLTVEAAFLTPKGKTRPEGVKLLKWISGPASAKLRASIAHQIVPLPEVWNDPSVKVTPAMRAFYRASVDAVPAPASLRMRSTWVPAETALKSILRGAAADEALRIAQQKFDDATRPAPPAPSRAPALVFFGCLLVAGAWYATKRGARFDVKSELRKSLPAYAYVAHSAVVVLLLTFLPLFVGALTSLYAGERGSMQYAGFSNYALLLTARGGDLLGSDSFYLTLLITVAWTVVNLALHVSIGIVLGVLLARPWLKVRAAYRVLLILPWAVPSYVTALAWRGMFHRQFGAVNALLAWFGVEPIAFFAKFATAFSANVATNVWLGFPFMMVSTLGALSAIPSEVGEAALVDGATRWQRFTKVTLPLLLPGMVPSMVFGTVWTFNMFNVVFLVSGGEPGGSTDTLVSSAYRWAFTRGAQYGYAAAYSVVIFLILFVGTRGLERVAARMSRRAA